MGADLLQVGDRGTVLALTEFALAAAARRPRVLVRRPPNALQIHANIFPFLELAYLVCKFLSELVLLRVVGLVVVARDFDVVPPELLLIFPVERRHLLNLASEESE